MGNVGEGGAGCIQGEVITADGVIKGFWQPYDYHMMAIGYRVVMLLVGVTKTP